MAAIVGPGRWGTTEPALGVPVSLGTHFFNDLVEMQVLYLAPIPGKAGNRVNSDFVEQAPNQLPRLIPEEVARACMPTP